MSDFNAASVPIRSDADGTDQKVIVKIVDGTVGGSNQMSIDTDKAAKTLATGHDPGNINRAIRTTELGALNPDGVYSATQNTKPGNLGLIASTRSATPGDATQTQRLSAIAGSANVTALDISLHDASGNPYTQVNPLPVSLEESPGNEVHNFQTTAALAAGATTNMDYSVTSGKTLKLKKVWASASGKIKVTVQTSPDGVTFTTKWIAFSSVALPNVSIDIPTLPISDAGTGAKVRVIIQNNELTAMDVFSTVSGTEY